MLVQGAQVVGDSLCGSSGLFGGGRYSFPSGFSYPSSPYSFSGFKRSSMPSELAKESPAVKRAVEKRQLPSDETENIVAIIQMGDPTFVPGKSYDVGTSVTRGLFPRSNTACFDQFASRIQSYCDFGDEFCASAFAFLVAKVLLLTLCSQAAPRSPSTSPTLRSTARRRRSSSSARLAPNPGLSFAFPSLSFIVTFAVVLLLGTRTQRTT